jgi:hypothetical protein
MDWVREEEKDMAVTLHRVRASWRLLAPQQTWQQQVFSGTQPEEAAACLAYMEDYGAALQRGGYLTDDTLWAVDDEQTVIDPSGDVALYPAPAPAAPQQIVRMEFVAKGKPSSDPANRLAAEWVGYHQAIAQVVHGCQHRVLNLLTAQFRLAATNKIWTARLVVPSG